MGVLAEVVGPWTFGTAALVVAGVPLWARLVRRPLSLEIGQVRAKVDGIDRAVNSRPAKDPVLYDVAAATKNQVEALAVDMAAITEHTAQTRQLAESTDKKLTEHLAYHQRLAESDAPTRWPTRARTSAPATPGGQL